MGVKRVTVKKKEDKDEDFDCKKAVRSIKVNGLKTLKKTISNNKNKMKNNANERI